MRNRQFEELARTAFEEESSVMLIGDLNITSWSPVFWELLRKGGLTDSRQGFGIQPTWPVWLPVLLIPIDHILVSEKIVIHSREVGPNIGSDHYPVVVDFSVRT